MLEYMKSKITKARAIKYRCAYFGVYEHHLLVAGNATNDADMLNMGARETVIGYLYDTDDIIFLNTPEDLGRYLQSL